MANGYKGSDHFKLLYGRLFTTAISIRHAYIEENIRE